MSAPYISPLDDFTGRHFTNENLGVVLAGDVVLGGKTIAADALPAGLAIHDIGIVAPADLVPRRLHGWPLPYDFAYTVRACLTPGGDLLAMCVVGVGQDWEATCKSNEVIAYRSQDGGMTWQSPVRPWSVDYSQHAFNPLVPAGGGRIYALGTELHPDFRHRPLSGGLGIRHSDDDGHSWSPMQIRLPRNDPGMRGTFHMQGCETRQGTWLLGTYTIQEGAGPDGRIDHQYVMRSEDRGESWELLPGPRPSGWQWPTNQRMMEGRVLQGRGNQLLMFTRTCEGHLWLLRSEDDGRTWSDPKPTSLVHPDAPPMIFARRDGAQLIALIHNRPGGWFESREELWISISTDDANTWSEPRLLIANAAKPLKDSPVSRQLSYADMIVHDGIMHIFLDHGCRQILHLQIPESRLDNLPTRAELID